ncbi:porin family protein [Vibrio ishigakensis]|nr:porin family protein [Vibrio ishigakensis]
MPLNTVPKSSSILIPSALLLLFSLPTQAEEFRGHRFGAGYSNSEIQVGDTEQSWGEGLKYEYGYDFNKLVGFNFSYEYNEAHDMFEGLGVDVEGRTFKSSLDFGYTFVFEYLAIKPYALLGAAYMKNRQDFHTVQGVHTFKHEETSFNYGGGVRLQMRNGIYSDLRFDVQEQYDIRQFSWTLGYRFNELL